MIKCKLKTVTNCLNLKYIFIYFAYDAYNAHDYIEAAETIKCALYIVYIQENYHRQNRHPHH